MNKASKSSCLFCSLLLVFARLSRIFLTRFGNLENRTVESVVGSFESLARSFVGMRLRYRKPQRVSKALSSPWSAILRHRHGPADLVLVLYFDVEMD